MKKINYDLIAKFQNGTATEAEKAEVLKWYRDVAERGSEFPEDEHVVEQFMLKRLLKATNGSKKRNRSYYWVAAASLAAIFCVAGYYLSGKFGGKVANSGIASIQNDKNNRSGAVLVLADGTEVDLSSKAIVAIPVQGGVKVDRTTAGEIRYANTADHKAKGTVAYNTIKTATGAQFSVVLSDGTKIWLNAGTSLKFPVDLSLAKERLVSLTGEGYFEVHRDNEHPFKVDSKGQMVEVLGTHFNINAYTGDAAIRTTLLEGSVKLTANKQHVKLQPGQEASLSKSFKVSNVNTANAIAWKDGRFVFEDERLETIMNAISRWYDVKVIYANDDLKNETYGMLSDHTTNIATLLKILAQTGDVKFKMTDRTVYVTK